MPRLIDADALYKMLSLEADDYMDLGRFERARGLESALCAIKYAPTVGGWVSLKDRPPEPEEKVLIYTKTGCLKYAQYHDEPNVLNPWYVYEDQARAWTNVISHWMPLPEPPKEEHDAKTDRR